MILEMLGIDVPAGVTNGVYVVLAIAAFVVFTGILLALREQARYSRQKNIWEQSHAAADRESRRYQRGQARFNEKQDRYQELKHQQKEAADHNRSVFKRFIDDL